ncbi:MAG TPA: NfeD family protein, partial [Desulfobaccales bacterium]
IPMVLTVSIFFIVVAGIVFRSHRYQPMTGAVGMVGERGVALTQISPEGRVFIHGEHWEAVSDEPIAAKEKVEVLEVKDLTLRVRRALKNS